MAELPIVVSGPINEVEQEENNKKKWWSFLGCCSDTYIKMASPVNMRMSHINMERLQEEKKFQAKIKLYSGMRIHMKKAQYCLEQEKRNSFYKELVIYVFFLFLVIFTVLSLDIHFPYEQNSALQDLYFDEEFDNLTIKKRFEDIMVAEELWQWAEGPLLKGFYELPLLNTRRIGNIQFRTGKVRGELCRHQFEAHEFSLFKDDICYPPFHADNEDKKPYGDKANPYKYEGDLGKLLRSLTFTPNIWNNEMDYGEGGYTVYLPRDNATAGALIVEKMKQSLIVPATAYVAVSFTLYNPSSDLFTHIQILFEISNTDYIEKTARTFSFQLLRSKVAYRIFYDNWRFFLLVIASVYLFYRELADILTSGLEKYIYSMWNVLDLLQLGLLLALFIQYGRFASLCANTWKLLSSQVKRNCSSSSTASCFTDMGDISWQINAVRNISGILSLVSVMIIFKYLRLNSRLNLMWRTLRFAAKDLFAFVIIFFIIFFGYSVMGYLLFGTNVRNYHSLSASLASCFQMLLGAFDYKLMQNANARMASIFFFSFMISVYLIFVNMFIAIMNEYYSLAQAEKKTHEENKKNLVTSSANKKNDDFENSMQFSDVEYDILKQLTDYVRGLVLRVKLVLDASSNESGLKLDSMPLSNNQHILLIDHKYLTEERRRLKAKFKATVRVIIICCNFIRPLGSFFKDFDASRFAHGLFNYHEGDSAENIEEGVDEVIISTPRSDAQTGNARGDKFFLNSHSNSIRNRRINRQQKRKSGHLRSIMGITGHDNINFPVSYVPVNSHTGHAFELLHCLTPGTKVNIDDGSLTNNRVTLEVLGEQEHYLPSPTENDHEQPQEEDTNRLSASFSLPKVKSRKKFGFHYNHKNLCDGKHIRACRVVFDGETELNGYERIILPSLVWTRYIIRYVIAKFLYNVVTLKIFRSKKKLRNVLISDLEVEQLIASQYKEGRGTSCRFDELVRNFRMFIAKKIQKKKLVINDMEEKVYQEAVAFVERFPIALMPLDKRESQGYKYTPQPINIDRIRLPNSINRLSELLSQNAHEVWSKGRIGQGWRWGPTRDNDKKLHPDLVAYECLTEEDKQYDRDTSIAALKVIQALGYILEPNEESSDNLDIEFGVPPDVEGETYEPVQIPTDDVTINPELKSLVELLAENTHEVWAKMRMEQGWRYGPKRDDAKREHNGLVPYVYLTPEEKEMDRNTAMQTVKVIIRCGFVFQHKDKKSSRSKKSMTPRFSLFGRSENPSLRNVGDAVSVMKSTSRAKNAFFKKLGDRRHQNQASLVTKPSKSTTGKILQRGSSVAGDMMSTSTIATEDFSISSANSIAERGVRRRRSSPSRSSPALLYDAGITRISEEQIGGVQEELNESTEEDSNSISSNANTADYSLVVSTDESSEETTNTENTK